VRRLTLGSITLVLGVALVTGCSSTPTMLVESDVPIPVDMQVVFSSELKRSGGTLSGGWFVFWGDVKNVVVVTDETSKRFSENGWRETSREMMPQRASVEFAKGDRTCHVVIDGRRVDPRSSSATLRVSSAAFVSES